MRTLSHSKCQKCGKVANVSELQENEMGIGSVCKDKQVCANKIKEKQNSQGISTKS